jgi:hypothetical protein
MGGCGCKSRVYIINREELKSVLLEAIEKNRAKKIEELWKDHMSSVEKIQGSLHIDEPLLTIQGVEVNALAYAIRLGRTEVIRTLLEVCGASISRASAVYAEAGKTPVDVICEHGFLDLLRYFLPKYLENTDSHLIEQTFQFDDLEDLTIFKSHDDPRRNTQPKSFSAIQRATEKGHEGIVRFLVECFRGKRIPPEYNPHTENEWTGENCGLIAVRVGNFNMLRYLHAECNINLHILNKRAESAIQIAVVGSKRHPEHPYQQIIKYLVEVVGVELLYHYEETLLVCEDRTIIRYIESKLHEIGMREVDKRKIEDENSLGKNRVSSDVPNLPKEVLDRLRYSGANFNFVSIFKEVLSERSRSYISSITPCSDGDPSRSILPWHTYEVEYNPTVTK